MAGDSRGLRTVRYEATFEAGLNELRDRDDCWRIDEVVRGVEWAVAQDAEHFPRSRSADTVRIVNTDPGNGVPALQILVRIEDDAHCSLLHIEERRGSELED